MSGCPENVRKVMRTPRKMELAVTGRCNLRCVYCYHFDSPADVDQDLPTAEWLRFFEKLNALNVLEVTIGGGEALIREDFRDLISGVVRNRLRFRLISNGTLISQDIASFLANTGRCNSVQISIDGPDGSIHDKNRGDGSFGKAMRGLKHLQRHGIQCTVRLTITRHNVAHLEAAAAYLLEEAGLPSFSTNSVCPFGKANKHADTILLSPVEYAQAIMAHHNIIEKYGPRVTATAGPLSSYRHWNEMESMFQQRAPSKPGQGHLTGCGGVFMKMAVRPDGIMTPCTQIPHIELGRINQDSLLEIWQNHPELKRLRRRRQIPLAEFRYCRGCPYRAYCRGGCPANAHALTGDENTPTQSIESCYRQFKARGGVLTTLKIPNHAARL